MKCLTIPEFFASSVRGLLLEMNLQLYAQSRIKAKVIVFSSPKMMQRFWADHLGIPWQMGKHCQGVTQELCVHYPRRRKKVHPVFFCVIGLVKRHLGPEIVSHEAVHAAHCYARRQEDHAPWLHPLITPREDIWEEAIAYPAGILTAKILANINNHF